MNVESKTPRSLQRFAKKHWELNLGNNFLNKTTSVNFLLIFEDCLQMPFYQRSLESFIGV